MGLGGAAEGATTVLALALLAIAAVVGLLLAGAVRWFSGRWLPALITLLVWAALVAIVPLRDYFSTDAREKRRVWSAVDEIVDPTGLGRVPRTDILERVSCRAAYRSNAVQPERAKAQILLAGPDPVARLRTQLTEMGYRVASGALPPPDDEQWVLGTRGETTVRVLQPDYERRQNRASLEVVSGCATLEPPEPRDTPPPGAKPPLRRP